MVGENSSSEEERVLINSSCLTLLQDTDHRFTAPQVSSESSSSKSVVTTSDHAPRLQTRVRILNISVVANFSSIITDQIKSWVI